MRAEEFKKTSNLIDTLTVKTLRTIVFNWALLMGSEDPKESLKTLKLEIKIINNKSTKRKN